MNLNLIFNDTGIFINLLVSTFFYYVELEVNTHKNQIYDYSVYKVSKLRNLKTFLH